MNIAITPIRPQESHPVSAYPMNPPDFKLAIGHLEQQIPIVRTGARVGPNAARNEPVEKELTGRDFAAIRPGLA
jgi:hypothetical protein